MNFREKASSFVLCNDNLTEALKLLDNASSKVPDQVVVWDKFEYDLIENLIEYIDILETMLKEAYEEGKRSVGCVSKSIRIMSTENNNLIAEFMGIESFKDSLASLHQGKINVDVDVYEQAQYHTSWDWLMPVVEEIDHLQFEEVVEIETGLKMRSLSATYNAVVEFINQYNN